MGLNPTPFIFEPNTMSFWDTYLSGLISSTNSLIFQDHKTGDYQIRGEGVRLLIPIRWAVTLTNDELVQRLIDGINVSLTHQRELGY